MWREFLTGSLLEVLERSNLFVIPLDERRQWYRLHAIFRDALMQNRRNTKAAKRFFRKLLKGLQYVPRVILADKLRSSGAAKREILPGVEHRQHKGLNNRAENSRHPTRLPEKKMRRFKSVKQAQRFLSAFGPISGHFQPRRHWMSAQDYHVTFQNRFRIWNEVTGVKLVS